MNAQDFGRYQLLKKLATGGMAEVWLARQNGIEGFQKNICIKRILPHLSEDPEFVQMFLNEAKVAMRFNHPNIAQIFDLGEASGSFFIAMEFIRGEDLGRLMRKAWSSGQWIARPLAIRIVASACEGLYYAHTQSDEMGRPLKVVHRDISPQNILISFEGGVKLVDFGIAKAADQASLTKSGAIKGKFAYMSPEQASGKALDHRSDIFAIGLVLYELLTGVRPLKRESELGTLQAALECNIEPPSVVADVPPEFDAVVMKALAKAADDRYRDARQFQMALEELLVSQRWVASSVQVAELMETLFADRLEEEKRLGHVNPSGEGSGTGSPAPPLPPAAHELSQPSSSGVSRSGTGNAAGRSNTQPLADAAGWEAPPGEERSPPERRERTRSVAPRSLSKPNQPRVRTPPPAGPPASVPAWDAPPALEEDVKPSRVMPSQRDAREARDREARGEPRRATGVHSSVSNASNPPPGRSRVDVPAPRRNSLGDAAPAPATPPRRPTSQSQAARRRAEEEVPEEDPDDDEKTRGPDPEPEQAPRRRTSQLASAAAETRRRGSSGGDMPEAPAPRRASTRSLPAAGRKERDGAREPGRPLRVDDEPLLGVDVTGIRRRAQARSRNVLVTVGVLAGLGVMVIFGRPLLSAFRSRAADNVIFNVVTSHPVVASLRHSEEDAKEPVTTLGEGSNLPMLRAKVGDTLVLENAQGVHFEQEFTSDNGGQPLLIKQQFRMGSVELKVTPSNLRDLIIKLNGQDVGHFPGPKFDIVEGDHTLELSGSQLKDPASLDVKVVAGQTVRPTVNLAKLMQ